MLLCSSCQTVDRKNVEQIKTNIGQNKSIASRILRIKTFNNGKISNKFYCIIVYNKDIIVSYSSEYQLKIINNSKILLDIAKQLDENAYYTEFD